MTERNLWAAVLFALVLLIGAADAGAQTPSQRDSPLFKACGTDLLKHCRSVSPGNGRALACLQARGEGLSAACQAELPRLARCSQEAQRWCGDTPPAEWRACLETRRDQFSDECRQMAPR